MNRGQKVLGTQQFNDTVYHLQDITFYNILCDQVALVITETADTEIARHKESLGILTKEQQGGLLELSFLCYQVQASQHSFCR